MTFPTYEEWGEKIAEQVIDVYTINGRTIREWSEVLSDELTMLDKISAEIQSMADDEWNIQVGASKGLEAALEVIDRYREGEQDETDN